MSICLLFSFRRVHWFIFFFFFFFCCCCLNSDCVSFSFLPCLFVLPAGRELVYEEYFVESTVIRSSTTQPSKKENMRTSNASKTAWRRRGNMACSEFFFVLLLRFFCLRRDRRTGRRKTKNSMGWLRRLMLIGGVVHARSS